MHAKGYRDLNWLVAPLIPLFASATCCCGVAEGNDLYLNLMIKNLSGRQD